MPQSYLIRNATLVSQGHNHHLQKVDILISQGVISEIGKELKAKASTTIEGNELFVTEGWFDLRVHLSDPGNEHKDSLKHILNTAAAGGFTGICTLPDSAPEVSSKSILNYLNRNAEDCLTSLYPTGVISTHEDAENLAELYDMHMAGAVAFTNGDRCTSNGLLKKALLYTQPFSARIISLPIDQSLQHLGMVNESENTIHTGLKSAPSLAEYVNVREQLEVAKYCSTPIHFAGITCKESVELIAEAKKKGQAVTCDTTIFNLCFTDEAVLGFDENFKLYPVLRTDKDRKALIKGLLNGTIDAICSNHFPQNIELKQVEFDYADVGALSLQTVFSWYQKHLTKSIDFEMFVSKLTDGPRGILGQEKVKISEGEIANLAVFDAKAEWVLDNNSNQSMSRNTHEWNKPQIGKAVGVFNNKKVNLY